MSRHFFQAKSHLDKLLIVNLGNSGIEEFWPKYCSDLVEICRNWRFVLQFLAKTFWYDETIQRARGKCGNEIISNHLLIRLQSFSYEISRRRVRISVLIQKNLSFFALFCTSMQVRELNDETYRLGSATQRERPTKMTPISTHRETIQFMVKLVTSLHACNDHWNFTQKINEMRWDPKICRPEAIFRPELAFIRNFSQCYNPVFRGNFLSKHW